MKYSESLAVMIPAYNEEATIGHEIDNWLHVINDLGPNSFVLVVDDGSTDQTGAICKKKLRENPNFKYVLQPHSGMGPALRTGYNTVMTSPVDFVFHADADSQTVSSEFWSLWKYRNEAQLVIGHRIGRADGWLRVVLSRILRFTILILFGCNILDANVPFRLMKKADLQEWLKKIPKSPLVTSAMMVVVADKSNATIKWVPIQFRQRNAGHSFFKILKIPRIGIRVLYDLVSLRIRI